MNNHVGALAVSGSTPYAGGVFTASGDGSPPLNYIASWNGSSWSSLGSGLGNANTHVYALAVSGGVLYAGGGFDTAGGKASSHCAEAILASPEFQGGPVHNTDGSVTLNLSTATNISSRLYSATKLAPRVVWQPICTNFNGGLWQFTGTSTAPLAAKFYRLSTP
ncbi:exported hypothetical protein [Verrucomicrobia bacterium]|nr:exported hypothetical protein [Verrucomicrobiota bacterium]